MPYWIYPGFRRPVVVEAATKEEADTKIEESPEYDGSGGSIYTVEEFAEMCEKGTAS